MPASARYRQMVDRFEEMACANFRLAPPIPDICAMLAVSPRTLVRAVRAIHGTTPSHHRHALALSAARRALLDGETASVREAALRFGFHELGRFAADYRAMFGENPSETLRRHWQQAADAPPRLSSRS
jgi:AraC-like DNA-binding protein